MPSQALIEFADGLDEIKMLRRHGPRVGKSKNPSEARAAAIANRRSCTVLLSSHYERFIYALNEETVDFLNRLQISTDDVPEAIKLLQCRESIDLVAKSQWDRRGPQLSILAVGDLELWRPGVAAPPINPDPLLGWMKAPKVRDIKRYFKQFDFDVFKKICRADSSRRHLSLNLQSLVDNRNAIAHGDRSAQPGRPELSGFVTATRTFCERTDREFGKHLAARFGSAPW